MSVVEKLRAALQSRTNVQLALLFGSQARGHANASSDVDVAVQGSGIDLLSLGRDLSLVVGTEVDVIDIAEAGYPLLKSIVKDSIVIWEAHKGAAASWRARAITSLETDRPWFERMRNAYLKRVAEGCSHG